MEKNMSEDIFAGIRGFAGRRWRKIIIHHSLTKDGNVPDWESIRKWQTGVIGGDENPYTEKPMIDIGYNFGLDYYNDRYNLLAGRSLSMDGAHTLGENVTAIGICVVGNYDLIPPTNDQLFILSSLIRELQRKFTIPRQNVLPHWAFADKSCPGKLFNLVDLRNRCL